MKLKKILSDKMLELKTTEYFEGDLIIEIATDSNLDTEIIDGKTTTGVRMTIIRDVTQPNQTIFVELDEDKLRSFRDSISDLLDLMNKYIGATTEDYWHEELEDLVNDYRSNPLRDSVKMHEFVRKVIKNGKTG